MMKTDRMRRWSAAWLLVAVAVALAGCGGSSGQGNAEQITVAAYGPFPAQTIPVTEGSPAQCRRYANAFSRSAVSFLAPWPSDADNYVVIARVQFVEFKAHLCDVAILRDALMRRTTAKQREAIIAGLPFLDDETGRELTNAS
jgi:hypothetical protein